MNHVSYYRATEADIPIISSLRTEFLMEFAGAQPQEAIDNLKSHVAEYLQKALKDQSCIMWLAKEGEKIVAIGGVSIRQYTGNFLNPSGKTGYLFNMYTLPGHRGKGICSTILHKLMDTAQEQGITAFELHASKDGEPVYVKHGFKLHHEPTYRKMVG